VPLDGGRVRYSWPATQARLRFEGSELRASIGDEPYPTSDSPDFLDVEIDGVSRGRLELREGVHDYTLVSDLPAGQHVATLTKRTEAMVGTVEFHGFYESDGTRILAAPAPRPRRFEVIGDSISAGWGAVSWDFNCSFDPAQQDAAHSFVSVAARVLDADVVVQAWSGKGLTRNYEPDDREPISSLYGLALPENRRSPRRPPDRSAQAIVIAVGTNDFVAGAPERAAYEKAYYELLARARQGREALPLVLVVSPMLTDEYPSPNARTLSSEWIQSIAKKLSEDGAKVQVFDMPATEPKDLGCGRHPNIPAHGRLGRALARLLRPLLP
jgi:lysophospholipase L1-like esterase